MPANCVASEEEVAGRRAAVQRMLRPIVARPPIVFRVVPQGASLIIAAHDSAGQASRSYKDWRFKTLAPSIYGNYFEVWMRAEAPRVLRLSRLYLTLFQLQRSGVREEREVVALHCDPYEPEGGPHWRYKRSPHLHVKLAYEPIPRAHFALNLLEGDSVVESVERLMAGVRSAIMLLRDQVLDLYSE